MARKKIREEIEIPEGMNVEIADGKIKISKGGEEVEKKLNYPVDKKDNKIVLKHDNPSKKQKKNIMTMVAHINNLISGLQEKYEYKLKICSVHFPITVDVEKEKLLIKNFQGEKIPREAKILPNVEVDVKDDIITVKSSDKEKAGQTAANIETATIIRGKDRRIFQDGIFITKKEKGRRK